MESHTKEAAPTFKVYKAKLNGFIKELPHSSKLVLEAPHNMLHAKVTTLHPAGRLEGKIRDNLVVDEEFFPWTTQRKPLAWECDLLNDWKRSQKDNRCNGRHATFAQSMRCTGAGRASNPDFRPYPVINMDKVTRDFGVNTPYRGPKPSMRATLQPPMAYPNRESGARPMLRALLKDKYTSIRGSLSQPFKGIRGLSEAAMQETPLVLNRIVTPDTTIFLQASAENPRAPVVTHTCLTSSNEDVPDLDEAEVSKSGTGSYPEVGLSMKEEKTREKMAEMYPKYNQFEKVLRMNILARMKGDVELANYFYVSFVVSGYTKTEIIEHLNMTNDLAEQKEKEHRYAASTRTFLQKKYPSEGEVKTQRRKENQWKLELLGLMRSLKPSRYFNWLPRETQCQIAGRIHSIESLLPYYLNNICKGMSVRQIQTHLNNTSKDYVTQEWEIDQCKRLREADRAQARGEIPQQINRQAWTFEKSAEAEDTRHEQKMKERHSTKRLLLDTREMVSYGVRDINQKIKGYQDIRQELTQVIDLTKENNELLNLYLGKNMDALEAATVSVPPTDTVPVPTGPSTLVDLPEPQASSEGESKAQAETDVLVKDLMDTGIIDKSVFQPENWAQAPKPLNSDIEGAIKEAMMEPKCPSCEN